MNARLSAQALLATRAPVAMSVPRPSDAGTPRVAAAQRAAVAASVMESTQPATGSENADEHAVEFEPAGGAIPTDSTAPTEWPDDAAESAFLAEARDRGEVVKATPAAVEAAEDAADPKALPKLDDLVNRIPAEVRDALEDLFRAKFVRVQRVPKRVLNGKSHSAGAA